MLLKFPRYSFRSNSALGRYLPPRSWSNKVGANRSLLLLASPNVCLSRTNFLVCSRIIHEKSANCCAAKPFDHLRLMTLYTSDFFQSANVLGIVSSSAIPSVPNMRNQVSTSMSGSATSTFFRHMLDHVGTLWVCAQHQIDLLARTRITFVVGGD